MHSVCLIVKLLLFIWCYFHHKERWLLFLHNDSEITCIMNLHKELLICTTSAWPLIFNFSLNFTVGFFWNVVAITFPEDSPWGKCLLQYHKVFWELYLSVTAQAHIIFIYCKQGHFYCKSYDISRITYSEEHIYRNYNII